MTLRISILILLVFVASCAPVGGRPTATVGLKTRTVKELIAEKGQPKSKDENVLDRKLQIYRYDGEDHYQVDPATQVVQARFRQPEGNEMKTQYWLHEFEGCKTTREEVKSKDPHDPTIQIQLTCPAKGKTVIFNQGSGNIQRVVEHDGTP